ncbi:hypothetical protein N7510_006734 [Penicillium lagena]|uniref:uncharacterized protein n=1 Tax=Penicillium lagena TaxID=94218 RepID=UPI00254046A6|nr:uncharacterized protein N7510_006734 [Penicillium lagena]KAJ5610015.1 hypothetical protein N7510_006734 [Penicillium lagena]
MAFLDNALAAGIAIAFYLLFKQTPKPDPRFFVSPQVQDGLGPRGLGLGHSARIETRNIRLKLDHTANHVVVFWGSQSGTAERLAKALVREFRDRYGMRAIAADLDDFDYEHLESLSAKHYVGFVVATFGEGDPTDNAAGLHQYLTSLDYDHRKLHNLNYFVFGLGNSTYQYFNRFAGFVDQGLGTAGAQRIGPVGMADEIERSDDVWNDWKHQILDELLVRGVGKKSDIDEPVLPDPDFKIVDRPSTTRELIHLGERNGKQRGQWQPIVAPVCHAQLISQPESGISVPHDYLHIALELPSGPSGSYHSGDHVAIWPMAPEDEVQRIARLFGWSERELHTTIDLVSYKDSSGLACSIPSPTTRDAILRHYLDICGAVSREVLQVLVQLSPTPTARSYLTSLMREDGTGWQLACSRHLTVGRLMEIAGSNQEDKWPATLFEQFIQCLPVLQPRYFSIASSPYVEPRQLAITVAVLVHETLDQQRFYGLATNYLYSIYQSLNHITVKEPRRPQFAMSGPGGCLTSGDMYIQIRPSTFKLPREMQRPVILFASGSGIAPFRGFIQERVRAALDGQEIGSIFLFFGCRNTADCLYHTEWEKLQESLASVGKKSLLDVNYAFSRMGKREYVQDRMASRQQDVLRLLLEDQASAYICGSVKLSSGVKSTLRELIGNHWGWEEQACAKYLEDLKESGRLREDVWA